MFAIVVSDRSLAPRYSYQPQYPGAKEPDCGRQGNGSVGGSIEFLAMFRIEVKRSVEQEINDLSRGTTTAADGVVNGRATPNVFRVETYQAAILAIYTG